MTASPQRIVNVHEAKTHFSRLIDAAHTGETIVVAKGGKPWARLVPLEQPAARRMPGVLAGRITLPPPEVLLEPLPEEELAGLLHTHARASHRGWPCTPAQSGPGSGTTAMNSR